MTVGYHAPARYAKTGVADYAWTLFEALRDYGAVIPNARHADIHLYHLGNNSLHEDIYARALANPGAVLLHDAVLHHFLLGTLTEDQYLREWTHNYGDWKIGLGRELWRDRSKSAVDDRYFRYPMLRRAVEKARLVLVHNAGAAALAKAHGANRICVVPHFVEEPTSFDTREIVDFRTRVGAPPGTFLFGIFGYLRETKRVVPCLRAFRRLNAVRPNTRLLLTGQCESRELSRLLAFEADSPAIYMAGHLPESEFKLAAASIDCCLNLRYPSAGETSGIAVRLMAAGKLVILTESLENSGFPDISCIRISSGIAEDAELFDYMGLAADFPPVARHLGERSARHLRERHSLAIAARQIWEALTLEVTCASEGTCSA